MTQEIQIDPEFLAREYTGIPGMAYQIPNKKDAYAIDVLDGEPVCDDSRMFADCTISTNNPDYDGDVIDQTGLDFHYYATNPVVAFKHWEWDLPVGISQTPGTNDLLIDTNDSRTRAGCYFAQSNPDAVVLYALIRDKFLRASSIGFIPRLVLRHDRETQARVNAVGMPRKKDYPGYRVANSQVHEWSWLPVGANPEAVRKAITDGNVNGERLTVAMTKSLTPYAAPKPIMAANPGFAIGPTAVDIVGQAIDRGLEKLADDVSNFIENKKAMAAFGSDALGGALVNPVTVGSEVPEPKVESKEKSHTISAAKALEKYRAPISIRMTTKKGLNMSDTPGGAPNADKPITPGLALVLAVKELIEQFLPIQESPAVIEWAKGIYTGGQNLQATDYPEADAAWDPAYVLGDEESALDETETTGEDGGSASDVVEGETDGEKSQDEGSENEPVEGENDEDEEVETDKSSEMSGDTESDSDGENDSDEPGDDEEDEDQPSPRKAESDSDEDDQDEEDDQEDEDEPGPSGKKELTPTPVAVPADFFTQLANSLNEATANIARGMRVITGITGKK